MERRGPSHLGPYGLACTNCFKAKCKCVARPDGEGCQRCHRLHKQCRPSDSIRRRTIDKTQNSASRIADLEGEESAQQFYTSELEAQDGGHPEDDDDYDGDYDDNPRLAHQGGALKAVAASDSPEPQVSDREAETLIGTFRSCMLSHFPFVHLPATLSAHQLRCDRPFLFRAIMCVASPSAKEKATRGTALKAAIIKDMLGRDTQSSTSRIDLLLALLTYISWGWDHVLNGGSLLRLMSQANLLASEIRVDGPPGPDAHIMALFTPGFGSSDDGGPMTREDFLAQQRAVLACFALSSVVSAYCGQAIDELRWTPQMDDGLAAISNDRSCPTDSTLAIQVRLQLLAQKSVQIHQHQQLEQGQVPVTELANFQAIIALTTLQTQRQEIQTSLSPTLPERDLLTAHIHAAELSISEVTHAVSAMVPIMITQFSRMAGTRDVVLGDGSTGTHTSTGSGTDSGGGSGTDTTASARHERVAYLWQCVRAVQACSAALLTPAPARFRGISLVQWAQLAHCAVALHRLTVTCDDAAWDRAAVREVVDLSGLLGRVAAKLELAAMAGGAGLQGRGPDEVFTRLARTIRAFSLGGSPGPVAGGLGYLHARPF
ncbi:hypothetical protein CHGG_07636 [Chaetomium globosum CBS 148.51]|uniref:Zn(2)-C6 fungal-type domain-containing protein n=1 Tax=Chaetomium globosum (strain ATCC 6205 / CBS 148.51 / DSM 1962 / NBRC 6347 / NRRL 1970) TaxID=306901 RepID=Q2GWL8_CHAGB|nr:uncharacterized protein CHGG_07636 [Chaetomium globosum CBS 148.51]EAQ86383.1 hypothetical protein CHGG_07636 [Chaetomium globosum CBS 148.51]